MKNIGNMDRILRFILGAALIGAVPFVTASLGTCPFYTILKIKTNK